MTDGMRFSGPFPGTGIKKDKPRMHKCPTCKGTGEQALTVVTYGKENSQQKIKITCIICQGKKVISSAEKAAIKREKAMWCRCKIAGDQDFHPDTANSKHHWTCSKCGKVTQVG